MKALRATIQEHDKKLASLKQRVQAELDQNIAKSKFMIEAGNVTFNYKNTKIIDNSGFGVKKGDKIAAIGANCSDKYTFIKLLTKQPTPNLGKLYMTVI